MSQITTVTFFRFKGFKDQLWAMSQMYYAHAHLRTIPGQTFYKLMGSGKNDGFNLLPDTQVCCLLQTWDSECDAIDFFEKSTLFAEYKKRSIEHWTIYCRCLSVKGQWNNTTPFVVSDIVDAYTEKIVVITRASIRTIKLLSFWKFVPRSHPKIKNIDGLIYSKGIGDVPLTQMATFSLWNSLEEMKKFAYGSMEHREAMKRKTKKDWYAEELFARFQPYKFIGSWSEATFNF